MKTCTVCGKTYDDSVNFCLEDGSVLTDVISEQRGFGSFNQIQTAPKSSFPLVAALLGGGTILALLIGVFALVIYLVNRPPANNNRRDIVIVSPTPGASAKPQASPTANPKPSPWSSNSAASNKLNGDDSTQKTPADALIDNSYTGTVKNNTAGKFSGVTTEVSFHSDVFYLSGRLDNKNLFGRFDDMPGKVVVCPGDANASICVQFTGRLIFGNDGSGFPNPTIAPFTVNLNFNADGSRASGTFEVGTVPKFENIGKQRGTVSLTKK